MLFSLCFLTVNIRDQWLHVPVTVPPSHDRPRLELWAQASSFLQAFCHSSEQQLILRVWRGRVKVLVMGERSERRTYRPRKEQKEINIWRHEWSLPQKSKASLGLLELTGGRVYSRDMAVGRTWEPQHPRFALSQKAWVGGNLLRTFAACRAWWETGGFTLPLLR